jgi:hypothetical protein
MTDGEMPRKPIDNAPNRPVDHRRVVVELQVARLSLPEQMFVRVRDDSEVTANCVGAARWSLCTISSGFVRRAAALSES